MGGLTAGSPIRTGDQAGVATTLAKQVLAAKPGTKYVYTFRGFAAVLLERYFLQKVFVTLLKVNAFNKCVLD
jgi:hypothetical protein